MFEVELDIFSGRPNPRWTLTPAEEAELLERMLDRTVPYVRQSDTDGYLGYRGFLVSATGATAASLTARGLPTAFRVRDGLHDVLDAGAESWLLFSADGTVEPVVAAAAQMSLAEAAAKCKKPHFTSTTDFSDWNASGVMGNNNCYNYASNYRTDTFAQPGRGTGQMYSAINVAEILAASLRDGYSLECKGGKKKKNLWTGFAIWPGVDYHWWRRTAPMSGEVRWCHKPGGTAARNYDSSGDYITDPETCNRGGYTQWGYKMFFNGGPQNTVVR